MRDERILRNLAAGLVAQHIGRTRRHAGNGGRLADRAGQRQMVDELALPLCGPAGVAVTGGSGDELGRFGRGHDVRALVDDLELGGHGRLRLSRGVAPCGSCPAL